MGADSDFTGCRCCNFLQVQRVRAALSCAWALGCQQVGRVLPYWGSLARGTFAGAILPVLGIDFQWRPPIPSPSHSHSSLHSPRGSHALSRLMAGTFLDQPLGWLARAPPTCYGPRLRNSHSSMAKHRP